MMKDSSDGDGKLYGCRETNFCLQKSTLLLVLLITNIISQLLF